MASIWNDRPKRQVIPKIRLLSAGDFHGTFTDPQSVVRALLRREVKLERSLRTSGVDKAEMEGFVAALTDSLTAKSE
jgi:hypothetical protein